MATNCLKVKCLLVLVCVSLTTSEENVQEWTDSVVTEWAEVTRQRHDRHVSIDNDHVVESNKDSHHVDEVIEHVENRRFYDGRDKTTHYEDDEDALSSNAHDAEINGDSYHIDELIESVENRTVYDARNKTTHYEGVDYTTRFPHFEWAGVYERQSDPVLGPDHKEERETLTDQLEDNNGGEINPRGNKANITDEPEDQTPPGRKMTGRENQTIFTQEVFINTHVSVSIEATPETDLDGEREISDIETNLMKTYINNTNEDSKNITSDDLRVVIEDANETNAIRLNERFRGRITATKVSSSVASYQHLDASLEVPEYLQTSSVKNDYTETTRFTTSNDNTIPVTTVPYEISSEDIDFENKTPMYKIDEEPHINTRFEAKQEENSTEAMHQSKDVKQSRKWETLPVAKRIYAFNIDRSDVEHNFDNTLKTSAESSKEDLYPLPIQNNDKIISKDSLKSPVDNNYANVNHLGASVLFEPCTDCDLRILPIRPSQQRSTPDIEEESLPTPQINFADPPEGRELKIYSLGLTDGIYFFSYLSEFLSWIQPNDFPVELLRDSLKHQTTWISLILESVQVEAGFVVCLAAVVLLALAVPLVVLSHACYRMGAGDERDDDHSAAGGWAGNCKRRSLVAILQLLLILLFIGMAAMFVTNEQLSGAVVRSPEVLQTSLSDVSAFVHNAHLHIHFLVIQSLDQTLQAVFADLDNVDSLLGLPIQRELVKETGLDVGLETLSDLTREAKSTTESVERLLDEARTAQEMVASARDKLSDLRQQVELFRRACGPRDRTLCDSIDTSGLDVTFRLDRIKLDERLNRMRRMGGVGLEVATREARERFTAVPARVEIDTRDAREGVRRQLIRQREEVDDRSRALEEFTRDITAKVNEAKYQAGFWMQHLDEIEYWRWIVCLGGGAAVLMIWTMLLCSLCCGCCGSEKAAGPTILVALVLMCLFSSVLWTVVLVGLLVGGHGEVFLCRPLFDEPDFPAISRLVDEPGVFYDDHHGGFIANVIYGNDSLDIPIKQVLQDCQANRPVYPTLGLRRVFDVEAAVDDHRWVAVDSHLRAVRANLSSLEVLSPALQDQLADLLATLSVNFTEHRIQMSRPVTSKDMDSFAKQLDNIGNQMRDLATASRMETLSSRTRRLIESHIRPLEGKKDSLVYQLTALEVQTGPLQRQVNQSFSHLKTIQFFINSQGESIAQRKSREYASRLQSYVAQLRAHVTEAVGASVAPCRPLWDIFHSARLFFCRHTMDPLNGYWFATTCSLLVLLIATPVCLKLVDYYRLKGCRSSGSPENLVASEQNAAWSSPGDTTESTTSDNW